MARNSIYSLSQTDNSNTEAATGIAADNDMSAILVDDLGRANMALTAEMLADLTGTTTPGTANDAEGTADALTATANASFTTQAQGRRVSLKAAADNTGAATLAVNGLTAKKIRIMTTAGDTDITAGMITEGGIYELLYDTDLDTGSGGWLLLNPTPYTGAVDVSTTNGTAAAPSISFADDTDTGMYRIGTDNVGFAANGAKVFEYNTAALLGPAGTVSLPGIGFHADPDSGMYRIGANNIGFSVNGTKQGEFSTTAFSLVNDLCVGVTSAIRGDQRPQRVL